MTSVGGRVSKILVFSLAVFKIPKEICDLWLSIIKKTDVSAVGFACLIKCWNDCLKISDFIQPVGDATPIVSESAFF